MANKINTSLLLIAKIIPTKEGYVWRVATVITGPDLEEIARDHTSPNHIPLIVPMEEYRSALWSARRKIDQLVAGMNRHDFGL